MASATSDLWWTALEKSNLLSAEQLAEARADAARGTAANDAKTLAERLVQRGMITRWQADQLLAGRSNLFLGRYRLEKRIGKGGIGGTFPSSFNKSCRAAG